MQQQYRETGLPRLIPDEGGERNLLMASKAIVRAVYQDTRRVDLETEDGSILHNAIVVGSYMPPVHTDNDQPSYVVYMHMHGSADVVCFPLPWRRLLSPADTPEGQQGQEQPERRRYDLHGYIFRSGKITVRITHDDRHVIETEEGDYVQIDTNAREVTAYAPTIYLGTKDETRGEYQRDEYWKFITPHAYIGTDTGTRMQYDQDEKIQWVIPNFFLGATGQADADGISYTPAMLHLVSSLIKLTAGQIILDPTNIKFGSDTADERLVLGDAFMAFLNVFLTLFNAHTHTGVQTGAGTSGVPTTPATLMTDALLSTVARTD